MAGVRRVLGLTAVVVSVALLAVACSSDNDDDSADGGGEQESVADQATDDAGLVDSAAAPEGEPLQTERTIIYTANMIVRVDDVEEAAAEAVEITEAAGGLLFSQDLDLEGEQEGRLTLKVPPEPDQLESVMDAIADLGDARDRQLSGDDVTAEVVDLDGRLQSARASADRLRTLLGDAANTTDLVTIEAELSRREGEIESLEGQLRVLNEQVDMATIDVVLTEDEDVDLGDDLPGFVDGLQTGVGVLIGIVVIAVAIVGFLLPFGVLVLLVWWGHRRRTQRRRDTTAQVD